MASRILSLMLLMTAMLGSEEKMFQPRFADGNQLARPEGFRQWMFVGSNLNMGYTEGPAPTESRFHNIYIQPEAYRQFATGFIGSGGAPPAQAKPFAKKACWNRHNQHGTADNV